MSTTDWMVETQPLQAAWYIYVSLIYSSCTKFTEGRSRVLYV